MESRKFFEYVDHVINDRTVGNEAEKIEKIKAVIEYEKLNEEIAEKE